MKNTLGKKHYFVVGVGINLNNDIKPIVSKISDEKNTPFQEISSLKNESENNDKNKKNDLFDTLKNY